MSSIAQFDLVGKTFDLAIPMTNSPDSRDWIAHCVIETVTETRITVFFVVLDWLSASFELPVPVHLDTLWQSIYISVGEIITDERIEYLCTL